MPEATNPATASSDSADRKAADSVKRNIVPLRDYFASHAMQALVSTRPWDEQPSPMVFAEWAYGVADAMLIQRDRK